LYVDGDGHSSILNQIVPCRFKLLGHAQLVKWLEAP